MGSNNSFSTPQAGIRSILVGPIVARALKRKEGMAEAHNERRERTFSCSLKRPRVDPDLGTMAEKTEGVKR